jgi:SP family sugar:H+ symporter-like MFS transporter
MMATFYVLGSMILSIQNDNGGSIPSTGAVVGAKGYVAMVCIYVFAMGFETSWGPITWIVCSEIFPTRIRAVALSIGTAFNWAMNAIIAKVTPIMIANITAGAYFFYGSMAVLMGIFVYFLLPETKGRSLEEIDAVSYKVKYHLVIYVYINSFLFFTIVV